MTVAKSAGSVVLSGVLVRMSSGGGVDEFVVFVYGEDAVGGEAFYGEGACDADGGFVFVGFVVEEFLVGFGGDGGVNFFLAGDAGLPPVGVELFGGVGPSV